MRRTRGGILLLILLGFILSPAPVAAQNFSFEVPVQDVTVSINSDGTISLDYLITFANDPGADPIDIVDIGMPNFDYDLGSITATINGQPVRGIADSAFVSPGVEFPLGTQAVQSGATGTLEVHVGTVRNALGASTLQEAVPYASLVFTPSTFDPGIVSGNTLYTFNIILPPGVEPEQPRYHTPSGNWPGAEEPTVVYNADDRVVYTWTADNADTETIYRFGTSFPMALVPEEVVVATETPNNRSISFDAIFPFLCFGGIVLFIVGTGILGSKAAEKRKLQYLPPKIAVEGHGIKRGLTAVEAAILMEQPLDRVMSMILFSVLKKEAGRVISKDPLKLEITQPLPETLQPYEIDFCKAFATQNKADQRRELQTVIVTLVKSVSEKMKGFSRKETIDYYTAIMEKAWQQVTDAGTPEIKSEMYEQVMDWTMLDKEWQGRTTQTFGPQPVIVPTWWWRFDPGMGTSSTIGGGGGLTKPSTTFAPSTGGGSINLPKLPGSDFAASMVSGVETFSQNVVGNLTSFTDTITNKTNPVPKTTYTTRSGGGGGGGGRSCACACACAGCACACAGGGR